jgi:hypothetical protein
VGMQAGMSAGGRSAGQECVCEAHDAGRRGKKVCENVFTKSSRWTHEAGMGREAQAGVQSGLSLGGQVFSVRRISVPGRHVGQGRHAGMPGSGTV